MTQVDDSGLVPTLSDEALGQQPLDLTALWASAERLRAFIAASGHAYYRMSADWREAIELGGDSSVPAIRNDSSWMEHTVHPDDHQRLHVAIEAAIRAKAPLQVEHRAFRVDRSVAWVRSRAVPILDQHGEVVEWVGAAEDITQRKQDEADAQFIASIVEEFPHCTSAEEFFANAAGRLGEYIGVTNVHFGEVDESTLQAQIDFGWRSAESADLPLGRYSIADFVTDAFASEVCSGDTLVFDDTRNDSRLSGDYCLTGILSTVIVPFCENGKWVARFAVADTSPRHWTQREASLIEVLAAKLYPRMQRARAEAALRESEEKYRALFETMDQAFCFAELVRDEAGHVCGVRGLEVNSAFERMHTPRCRHLPAFDKEHKHPGFADWMLEACERVATTGDPERIETYLPFLDRWCDVQIYSRGEDLIALLYDDITTRKRTEDELTSAQKRDEFLLRLTDELRSYGSALEIEEAASRLIAEELGVTRAHYTEIAENETVAIVRSEYVADNLPGIVGMHDLRPLGGLLARNRSGVFVTSDIQRDSSLTPEERNLYRHTGTAALISVALLREGRRRAHFTVSQPTPREWTPQEVALVEEVAERTWASVEQARAEEALHDSLLRTTLLKDVAAAVATSLDAVEMSQRAVEAVRETLKADLSAVVLLEDSAGPAELVTHYGHDASDPDLRQVPLDNSTLAGKAMLSGRTQLAGQEPAPRDTEKRLERLGHADVRLACCPLVVRNTVRGCFAFGFKGRREFEAEEVELYEAVAHQLAIGLENARLYEAEHDIAETLQETLVVLPAHVPGVTFSRAYESATYQSGRVGGDFVDIFQIGPNLVGITLGDVSGKGIDAAVTTSLVRTTLRVHALDGLRPAGVAAKANQVLRRLTEVEAFVTLWFGVLNTKTGHLEYVCAGHPPALVIAADGHITELASCDPILGAFDAARFCGSVASLTHGDRLFLYSDGITEARSPEGDFLDADGLEVLLEHHADEPTRALAGAVMSDVVAFSHYVLRDDAAILCVEAVRLPFPDATSQLPMFEETAE